MSSASPTVAEVAAAPKRFARLRAHVQTAYAWYRRHDQQHPRLTRAFVGVSFAALSLMVVWCVVAALQPPKKYVDLDAALEALKHGDNARAIQIAGLYLPWNKLPASRQWIPPYVFGMVHARRAERLWGERGRQQHFLAARYLAEVVSREAPETFREQARFEVGRQFIEGGHPARAIEPLRGIAVAGNERATEAHRLLARAYTELQQPDWDRALRHNSEFLSDASLTEADREEGQLLQGRVQYERGELGEAAKLLESIPENSRHRAPSLYWQASVLAKAEGTARMESLRRAIGLLDQCILRDNWSARWSPQAFLLRSRCRRELNELPEALADLNQIEQLYPDSPVQQASLLDSATLLSALGRDDDALVGFTRMLTTLPEPSRLRNPWLSIEDARRAISQTYDAWMRRQDYERAFELARRTASLVGDAETARWLDEALRPLMKLQRDRSDSLTYDELQQQLANTAEKNRELARLYERLARSRRTSREYPELLWKAAEHRRTAGDAAAAVEEFTNYLETGAKPRRTQALLAIAECRLELDQPNAALAVLAELADLPESDIAKSRLPLVAARAHLQLNDVAAAETDLLTILDGDRLTPESIEWRDSLILYARLLYDAQRYNQAAIRWEEVLERYPAADEAREGRFLLAESYRRGADQQVDSLGENNSDNAQAPSSARSHAAEMYDAALRTYGEVIEDLSFREAEMRISPSERSMLRNALFGRGAALTALERYEPAAAAYLLAVHHCQDSPEVLDAMLQIAECYRRLNRPVEARGTLLQARLVLQRLPSASPFAETTNYTREEWSQLLDALIAL